MTTFLEIAWPSCCLVTCITLGWFVGEGLAIWPPAIVQDIRDMSWLAWRKLRRTWRKHRNAWREIMK